MESQLRALKAKIHSIVEHLTIPKLKYALRILNLSMGGRKNQLQERILWTLRDKDETYLYGLLQLMQQAETGNEGEPVWRPPPVVVPRRSTYTAQTNNLTNGHQLPPSFYPSNPPHSAARGYPMSGSVGPAAGSFSVYKAQRAHHQHAPGGQASQPQLTSLHFRKEPFYSVLRQMSVICEFRTPHLTPIVQGQLTFEVPADLWPALRNDQRLMLLCQRIDKQGDVRPIYYPFNSEIYVNESRVEANSRGIKGTEGSARPVDLTRNILRASRSSNRILFKFQVHSDPAKDDATRQKSFAMGVYLVQPHAVATIVEQLQQRPRIPKEESLKQLVDDEDDDIIQTESAHSLKDPVACVRMTLPIRSRKCQHIDCMDAAAFITFQQQAPTWKCPHCNNTIDFDSLAVDAFMLEILRTSKATVDRVAVSPDGSYKVVSTDSSDEESSDDDGPPVKRIKAAPEIIDLLESEDELEHDVAAALQPGARPTGPQPPPGATRGITPGVAPAVQPLPQQAARTPVPVSAQAPVPAQVPAPARVTAPAPAPAPAQAPAPASAPAQAPAPAPAPAPVTAPAPAQAPAPAPSPAPASRVSVVTPPAAINTPTPVSTPGQAEAITAHGPWSDPSGAHNKQPPVTATQPSEPSSVPRELGFDSSNFTVKGPQGPVKLPEVYTLSTGGAMAGRNAQLACLKDLVSGKIKVISRAPYFMPVEDAQKPDSDGSDADIILPPSFRAAPQSSQPSQPTPARPAQSAQPAPARQAIAPEPARPAQPVPAQPPKFNIAASILNAQRQVILDPNAPRPEQTQPASVTQAAVTQAPTAQAPATKAPAPQPRQPAANDHPPPQQAQPPNQPEQPPKINTALLSRVLGHSVLSGPPIPPPARAAPVRPPAMREIIDLTEDSDG